MTFKNFKPAYLFLMFVVFFSLASCNSTDISQKDYAQIVDPMIGTDWNGHTFPGATVPFGMVQLSPDTKTQTWSNCSGYHYSNTSILGFSHTHYSGTGEGGGADILFMPTTGSVNLISGEVINDHEDDYTLNIGTKKPKPIENTENGYRSTFSHENETASPGYYSVFLDDYNVKAELTATTRVGFHRYTFPASEQSNVILDLVSGNSDVADSLYVAVNKGEISGYRSATGGLDGGKIIYFVAEFSKPFKDFGLAIDDQIIKNKSAAKGKNVKAYFSFETKKEEAILLKVAISSVSIEGARENLESEIPNWDFEKIRTDAKTRWNKELNKIEVEGGTQEQQTIFYTALYHALIHPNINMDVDRQYKSTNGKIYTATDFDNYTTFSLWDTFRALHPMQTIINSERTNEFIKTFLERFDHAKNMPMMEFSGNEAATMIGYHSLPVLADAYVKGIRGYDTNKAFKAMKQLADGERAGKELYLQYGHIPFDKEGQSVSRSLEYSFDDWTVTRLAKDFNEQDNQHYSQRGQFYKNIYDDSTGFMRPKNSEYEWLSDFDPMEISNRYTEANAYQYTPSVFQDIEGVIKIMGGERNFENWLDTNFTTEMDPTKMHLPDVTGLIGQYAHGNEPSHHIAYLYNYVGSSWKTQELIREILTTLYTDKPDGISGNEDAGQMSAWYVLSSMGFYPVTPGMDYYVIGSPLFDKITIHLENGNKFEIVANNNSINNPYIQSIVLDGEPYNKSILKHETILNGSKIVFEMGKEPNKEWAKEKENRPYSIKYESAPMVKMKTTGNVFLERTEVTLFSDAEDAVIRYTLDGMEPDKNSSVYSKPFVVNKTVTLKAKCFSDGLTPGYAITQLLNKVILNPSTIVKRKREGLKYWYKEGFGKKFADLSKYPIIDSGIINSFNLNAIKDARPFGYTFEGFINVPSDGLYTFQLDANDGAILYLDYEILINNDGGHQTQILQSMIGLKKGLHPIKIDYFQMGRAKKLEVKWSSNLMKIRKISEKDLFH